MYPNDFRNIRRELGLTQTQLGALLELHRQTVYRRESGTRRIRRVEALMLRALMELTPAQRTHIIETEPPS